MRKLITVLTFLILSAPESSAQSAVPDSATFSRITAALAAYVPDTTAMPDDAITKEINKLRTLGGGFNIGEAIAFKIREDVKNNDLTEAQAAEMTAYFTVGRGKRLLDNAINSIYRRRFTLQELKELNRFYSSPAGRKMSAEFPVIMLQSLMAAQMVKDLAGK